MKALLDDLRALELMLETGKIESGVRRIGAEQEMFLVDHSFRPAPMAIEVLARAGDARLTTEIARFNLEANLTPVELGGSCLRQMEEELKEVIKLVRESAREYGADVLLAGILPTLRLSDLTLDQITPIPRYGELNRVLTSLRGGAFSVHIKGLDELNATSDNIMLMSSNTSFQVHLQVSPEEFVPLYNLAQAVTAPVLAAAVNSPLWLGHRLWSETRLAIFQHSADERSSAHQARSHPTRVGFGESWVKNSVLELFREDIARFRVILTNEPEEDSLAVLGRGGVPPLSALRLHNGTIWWWNRPCYGVAGGRAHLRIENRALPSGPTTLDEMANAAFFIGLMCSLKNEYGRVDKLMSFDDAKANFFAAARHGLKAQFTWIGGKTHPAPSLILEHLLPLARQGLKDANVEAADIDCYLGTIEERVRSGQTGAQWMLDSLATLSRQPGTLDMRLRTLTAAMHTRQQTSDPVHRWPLVETHETDDWSQNYQTVGQFMSTDLFTVRPGDLVDLAASVMDWRHVRHVPVEDDQGHLVGLVSHRALLRLLARVMSGDTLDRVPVRSIMKPDPVTVTPSTPTLEAIAIMRRSKVGCLPVVENSHLVGIVTAQDFLDAAARIFEQHLAAQATSGSGRT